MSEVKPNHANPPMARWPWPASLALIPAWTSWRPGFTVSAIPNIGPVRSCGNTLRPADWGAKLDAASMSMSEKKITNEL